MSDSDDNTDSATVPGWQLGKTEGASPAPADDSIEVARRFLDDDEIKTAPRDKKVAFLKAKGIEESDIQKLLGAPEDALKTVEIQQPDKTSTPEPPAAQPFLSTSSDQPPIVTYPEFLTKPTRPPPLVTTNGLLATLYAFAGLSTALYGTSKFLLAPMVEDLTDARLDLHDSATRNLAALVSQLEKTVSVVPPHKTDVVSEEASDVDDPSEMFHRDVGTQTSFITNENATKDAPQPESQRQADRLSTLTKSLSGLKDDFRTQSEDLEDVKTLVDVFRDDLDALTYGGQSEFVGGYDIYNKSRKTEPEDEIRKVRDNIRKVKGVLLSTRSFPTSSR